MIPIKLQLFLIVFSAIGLIMLINMIKKYNLELKYALLWIVLSIVTILLSIIPKISTFVSEWLGIETPVNTVFLIGIFIILMILFSLTVALSSSHNKIKGISQELGIYKSELKELKKRLDLK
jgi:hypothetical protein